jgi:hypothetical protein
VDDRQHRPLDLTSELRAASVVGRVAGDFRVHRHELSQANSFPGSRARIEVGACCAAVVGLACVAVVPESSRGVIWALLGGIGVMLLGLDRATASNRLEPPGIGPAQERECDPVT